MWQIDGSGTDVTVLAVDFYAHGICRIALMDTTGVVARTSDQCREGVDCRARTAEHGGNRTSRLGVVVVDNSGHFDRVA